MSPVKISGPWFFSRVKPLTLAAMCVASACSSSPDQGTLLGHGSPSGPESDAATAPPPTALPDAGGRLASDGGSRMDAAIFDAGPVADTEPGFSPTAVTVCPAGCMYTLPSQAVAAATKGALIEILAGSYEDCIAIRSDQVTVRGIGGFAHLHTKICDGKGVVVTYGQGTHLERLELSDFATSDYTGAGVRHDASGKDLTATNLYIHDGQFGILASSTGDSVTINASVFQRVGFARPDGEVSVPLYVTGASKLSVTRTRFLDGVGGASMIKSRALSTVVACSVIANLDGPDSYSIDLQLGNDFALINSVIEQGSSTTNKNIIAYGTSSFDPATGRSFTVQGNTFINDADGGTFLALFHGAPATFDVSGNTFIGSGVPLSGGGQLGSNQMLAARPPQLGAYPRLPDPGPCP